MKKPLLQPRNHPADFYDFIYHWKDYEAEARRLHEILAARGLPDGSDLLEAACGTGSYLVHLRGWYQVSGFDLDPIMLEAGGNKLPLVNLWEADMRAFEVPAPVDAIIALYGATGYLHADTDLALFFSRCYAALRPGGIFLVEPWLSREVYRVGEVYMQTYEASNFKLCRQSMTRIEGEIAVVDFHWLVGRAGFAIQHFVEPLRMRLRSHDQIRSALMAAGFAVEAISEGFMAENVLIVARRPEG